MRLDPIRTYERNRLTFQFTTIVISLLPIPFLLKCKIFSIEHVYVYIYIYRIRNEIIIIKKKRTRDARNRTRVERKEICLPRVADRL